MPAHAVIENHGVVFEMILKMDIGRQRSEHFHQSGQRQIVRGEQADRPGRQQVRA